MKFKTLDMNCDIDKKILLTYFFKNLNTKLDKEELSKLSCMYYNSEQNRLYALTNRFQKELEPYKEQKLLNENVDDTLQNILSNKFKIQEELVRCDFVLDSGIDRFYIVVIGVDFFLIESEIKHSL